MRTAIYVDGFNLFHRLLEGEPGRKWLDLKKMAIAALRPENEVCLIRYFTARVTAPPSDPDLPSRQDVYLRALVEMGVNVHYGMFKQRPKTCRLVNPPPPPAPADAKYVEIWHREEKGSDVNLAVHMLHDAWNDLYDCAVVVSNDSDLAEAMRLVRSMGKAVGIMCTANKNQPVVELRNHSHFWRPIRPVHLTSSQLPDPLICADGSQICCPLSWK